MHNFQKHLFPFYVGALTFFYYFLVMGFLGSTWQGYSWITHHMSELGGVESPVQHQMNIFGFMGVGLMILIFSWGLYHRTHSNRFFVVSTYLFALAGIFMVIVGFFPCDPHCIDVTLVGRLHTLTSIPQSIALPLGIIVSGIGLYRTKHPSLGAMAVIMGLGSLMMGPLLSVNSLASYVGLIQRIGMGLSLLWISVISFFLIRDDLFRRS